MTDKNDKTNQAKTTAAPTPEPARVPSKTKRAVSPVLLTVLAAAAVGGGVIWYLSTNQNNLSQQYAAQLRVVVEQSQKNEQIANQALSLVQNQTQQIQRLNQELDKTREQLADISVAVQTISDSGSDFILLNDIEQLVVLAQQQLLIGGNLANAIVSLETAQARLAKANRQSLSMLMQTINGDLDRLRAAQVIDVATLTAQLERLAELLNKAPLYVPDTKNSSINGDQAEAPETDIPEPAQKSEPSTDMAEPWWQRTLDGAVDLTQKGWQTIRQDLGQFVSIRRVDDTAALLMSPEQTERFRDNLNLRMTMAQLALMTKQSKVWQAEMAFVVNALERRFDPSLAVTQRALALAAQLADTNIDAKLPSIDNTLAAIENLKQSDQDNLEGAVEPAKPAVQAETQVPVQIEPESLPAEPEPQETPTDEIQTATDAAEPIVHGDQKSEANNAATQARLMTQQQVG